MRNDDDLKEINTRYRAYCDARETNQSERTIL